VTSRPTNFATNVRYRRYAIVGEQDLHEAARKLATSEHGRVIELGNVLGQMAAASRWLDAQLCDTSAGESGETGRRAGLRIVRTPEARSKRMRDLVRRRWAKAKKG
jgi:hypothetical protein